MDLDKTLRYCTAFQNLFNKGCFALDAMNRVEGKGIYAPALIATPQLSIKKGGVPDAIQVAISSERDVLQNEMLINS